MRVGTRARAAGRDRHQGPGRRRRRACAASRRSAGGRDVYEVRLPAVVGVLEGINLPRYPSVPGRIRAKSKPVAASEPGAARPAPGDGPADRARRARPSRRRSWAPAPRRRGRRRRHARQRGGALDGSRARPRHDRRRRASTRSSLQALTLGCTLAAGGPVHALLIGDAAAAARRSARWGATHVHVASHPALAVVRARCDGQRSSTTWRRASAPTWSSAPARRPATPSWPAPRPGPGSRSPPTAPPRPPAAR